MSDYLGEPRFKVTEIECLGSHNVLRTSFAIVDRAYCCAIVWSNYYEGHKGRSPVWARRVHAHEVCAGLNAK